MNLVHRLKKLFSGPGTRAALGPPGLRIYVVGDIHGRLDLLTLLHGKIMADMASAPSAPPHLVYLGDYVDRGLESRGVIDFLLKGPPPGFGVDYLKGNHEAAMLDFLKDPQTGSGWLAIGGQATLYSYGVATPKGVVSAEALVNIQRQFLEALPLHHVAFLENLKPSVDYGDFFFAHAGIRPGCELEAQSEEDLLWIRDDFLRSDEAFCKVIVHGHTVTPKPEFRSNRIGIDTGAFATGVLTCLVIDGHQMRLLHTP